MNIFIFPHAGGFSSQYFEFKNKLEQLECCDVSIFQYRGRESKVEIPFAKSMDELVYEFLLEFKDRVDFNSSIFFGHSFGAILIYHILKNREVKPKRVVLSSSRTPHNLDIDISTKDDDSFKNTLLSYGGMDSALIENREFFEYISPIIRSDFSILEGIKECNEYIESSLLECKLLYGDGDSRLSESDFLKWRDYFKNSTIHKFKGNHFFIFDYIEEISKLILE